MSRTTKPICRSGPNNRLITVPPFYFPLPIFSSISDLLPGLFSSRGKLVHVIEEQREGPDLLVGQGALPRGHAGPADAMRYHPERISLRIVLDAVCRQLRRCGIFALCDRRSRRITLRGAVADRAALAVKLDARNQIIIGQRHRIGTLGRLAIESRIQ